MERPTSQFHLVRVTMFLVSTIVCTAILHDDEIACLNFVTAWSRRFSEVLGLFAWRITLPGWREDDQTVAFRGSKSRNKVSVGEPAEGSLSVSLTSRWINWLKPRDSAG